MYLFEQKMLFKGGKNKAVTLSFDDGVIEDLRFIKLLDKYNVKGTFNLNSGLMPSKVFSSRQNRVYTRIAKEDIENVYKNHEVSTHSVKHMALEDIGIDRMTYEIVNDRFELEKVSNKIVRGFAYPYGVYNDKIIEVLKNSGIAYARTVTSTYDFTLPKNLYTWNPTIHQGDNRLDEMADNFLNYEDKENSALFYVWGHAYEFDNEEKWSRIEKFLKKIADKKDVWYATNLEIADYIQAYKRLIYSVDGSSVYNPTSQSIWIKTDCDIVEIKPNCQEKLKYNVFI